MDLNTQSLLYAICREYAKKIDADYYAKDAKSSVEIAKLTF